MAFEGKNYFANHVTAPQYLQGTPNYNVEVGEGKNPTGGWYPAGYLPMAISENRTGGSFFVLMPGKVVTLDSNGRLTNAGLILDKAAYDAAYAAEAGDANAKHAAGLAALTLKYNAKDNEVGVRDPATGLKVTADDEIYGRMKAAGIDVPSNPVGIMCYSALTAAGTDPSDPSTFFQHAYDTGGASQFSRWGYMQIPVIELNVRAEAVTEGTLTHRIALWTPDGAAPTFYKAGVLVGGMTQKATPSLLTDPAGAEPDQFAMVGRTIFFNAKAPANYEVRYQPKVDLPFTCLSVNYGVGKLVNSTDVANGVAEKTAKDYQMKQVGFNINGDFQLYGSAGCSTQKIGTILDVKYGKSEDLKLVRTYFRDQGLWQEAPGSSTDGRNAILSVANAPKYVVRIAYNFNVPF